MEEELEGMIGKRIVSSRLLISKKPFNAAVINLDDESQHFVTIIDFDGQKESCKEIGSLFHKLWTRATPQRDYNKSDWKKLWSLLDNWGISF